MEPLIAVGRVTKTGAAKNAAPRYIFSWIKRDHDAKPRLEKMLEEGEEIRTVWTCMWRNVPSVYKLVFGDVVQTNMAPSFDVAADLRKRNIKDKKPHGREMSRIERAVNTFMAAVTGKRAEPEPEPEPVASINKKAKAWHPIYTEECK